MEGVDKVLHLAAVVVDAKVALDEDLKWGVEMEGAGLTVAKELLLNGKPGVPSGTAMLTNNILEVNSESVEDPREGNVVHPPPMRKSRGSDVVSDVVIEGIALQCQ
jgi:hypothetical protein